MSNKLHPVYYSNCCHAHPEGEVAADNTGRCAACKDGALFYMIWERSHLGQTLKKKRTWGGPNPLYMHISLREKP